MRRTGVVVRRSRWALASWAGSEAHVCSAITGRELSVDTIDLALLTEAGRWREVDELAACVGHPASTVAARVARLVAAGVLERGDRRPTGAESSARTWTDWGNAALWFHAAARDVTWATADEIPALTDARAAHRPSSAAPPVPRGVAVALDVPVDQAGDAFTATLRSRRTTRRFSRASLTRAEASEVLHLSFGVQAWMQGRIGGPYALKTSPSGGACHPLDAFVVVQRVRGVAPGIYAYDADAHRLHRVRRGRPDLARWFPGQPAYAQAAMVCVLVARFERLQWKYHTPRAYRVVLLDAGHVGQTFCLAATHRGLGACCTGAFDDAVIERALGVDGIARAAIYAMGVGVRPRGAAWAPFPDAADVPVLTAPASARRARATR